MLENKTITMKIADNGIGFDSQRVIAGNGLHNMETRAQDLEAKFLLKSEKGQAHPFSGNAYYMIGV